MRRNTTTIVLIVLACLAIVGTGFVAYGRGQTAGENAAINDRSAFGQARGTTVAGGAGFGGQRSGGGAQSATGSQSAGGGQNGTGPASSVGGKVTKVDGATLTLLEQPNNIAVTVTTSAATTISTFAAGTLGDLTMGDVVALQGDKTGDAAYAAKTIFSLGGFAGNGGAGRTPGGSSVPQGTDTPGSPAAGGGRNRGAGNASGGAASAPAGRAGGAGLFAGFTGPIGRVTKIDNGTLSLQGFDGSTTTVTTNPSTSVRKQAPGTMSDIKTGDTVSVQGDPAGDTAYTARTVIDLGTAP